MASFPPPPSNTSLPPPPPSHDSKPLDLVGNETFARRLGTAVTLALSDDDELYEDTDVENPQDPDQVEPNESIPIETTTTTTTTTTSPASQPPSSTTPTPTSSKKSSKRKKKKKNNLSNLDYDSDIVQSIQQDIIPERHFTMLYSGNFGGASLGAASSAATLDIFDMQDSAQKAATRRFTRPISVESTDFGIVDATRVDTLQRPDNSLTHTASLGNFTLNPSKMNSVYKSHQFAQQSSLAIDLSASGNESSDYKSKMTDDQKIFSSSELLAQNQSTQEILKLQYQRVATSKRAKNFWRSNSNDPIGAYFLHQQLRQTNTTSRQFDILAISHALYSYQLKNLGSSSKQWIDQIWSCAHNISSPNTPLLPHLQAATETVSSSYKYDISDSLPAENLRLATKSFKRSFFRNTISRQSRLWSSFLFFIIIFNALLALFEYPDIGQNTDIWIRFAEFFFVIVYIIDLVIILYHSRKKSGNFISQGRGWKGLYFVFVFAMLVDVLLSLIPILSGDNAPSLLAQVNDSTKVVQESGRFTRPFRLFLLLIRFKTIRFFSTQLALAVVNALPFIFVSWIWLLGGSAVALNLFNGIYSSSPLVEYSSGGSYGGYSSLADNTSIAVFAAQESGLHTRFETYGSTFSTLFVTLTGSNLPQILLVPYERSPWSSLFFFLFLAVQLILMASMLGIIFSTLKSSISEYYLQKKLHQQRNPLVYTFMSLDYQKQGAIQYNVLYSFFKHMYSKLELDPSVLEHFFLNSNELFHFQNTSWIDIFTFFELSDLLLLNYRQQPQSKQLWENQRRKIRQNLDADEDGNENVLSETVDSTESKPLVERSTMKHLDSVAKVALKAGLTSNAISSSSSTTETNPTTFDVDTEDAMQVDDVELSTSTSTSTSTQPSQSSDEIVEATQVDSDTNQHSERHQVFSQLKTSWADFTMQTLDLLYDFYQFIGVLCFKFVETRFFPPIAYFFVILNLIVLMSLSNARDASTIESIYSTHFALGIVIFILFAVVRIFAFNGLSGLWYESSWYRFDLFIATISFLGDIIALSLNDGNYPSPEASGNSFLPHDNPAVRVGWAIGAMRIFLLLTMFYGIRDVVMERTIVRTISSPILWSFISLFLSFFYLFCIIGLELFQSSFIAAQNASIASNTSQLVGNKDWIQNTVIQYAPYPYFVSFRMSVTTMTQVLFLNNWDQILYVLQAGTDVSNDAVSWYFALFILFCSLLLTASIFSLLIHFVEIQRFFDGFRHNDLYLDLVRPVLWPQSRPKLSTRIYEYFKPPIDPIQLARKRRRLVEREYQRKHRYYLKNINKIILLQKIFRTYLESNRYVGLLRATKVLQPVIRGYLARKKFRKILKQVRTRSFAVKEILSTEQTYVADLKIMSEVFLQPLAYLAKPATPVKSGNQKKGLFSRGAAGRSSLDSNRSANPLAGPIISQSQIRTIFSEVSVIIGFNSQLLDMIQASIGNYTVRTKFASAFTKMIPILRPAYTTYVNNFENAQNLLQGLLYSNPEFKEMISRAEADPRCHNLSLESFLIMPVQRIPRYRLLLQEVLKNTWEWHPDYNDIVEALEVVKNVAAHINEMKRQAESIVRILEIQKNLKGLPETFKSGKTLGSASLEARMSENFLTLIQPHRRYIGEASINLVTSINAANAAALDAFHPPAPDLAAHSAHQVATRLPDIAKRYAFVFNDMLMLTRASKTIFGKSIYYTWCGSLPLKNSKCAIVPPSNLIPFALAVQIIKPMRNAENNAPRPVWAPGELHIGDIVFVFEEMKELMAIKTLFETAEKDRISAASSTSSSRIIASPSRL